jgi:hypothetical protein
MGLPFSVSTPAATVVPVGGHAITAMYGPVAGGVITNPQRAADQGIEVPEVLYVDITGNAAALQETTTTIPVQPGGSYVIPDQTTSVSVNAKTSGHRFSGFVVQPVTPYPPTPQPGTFPPPGPTTLTETIPSYLYEEYADDDDLQAFVVSFNGIAQQFVTWFATIGLPVYTNPQISGPLLDWVAAGIYGMTRPALSSGHNRDIGPFNTYGFNRLAYNVRKLIGPNNVTVTTDDIFKRIMTWNFYKGDGSVFNVRWLKRRIMRFLIGTNGSAPNIDQTYAISVTFGPGIISIRISTGTRKILGGAIFNRFGFNRQAYNGLQTLFVSGPSPLPYESVLKEAIESGVLLLPFQYTVSVTI